MFGLCGQPQKCPGDDMIGIGLYIYIEYKHI